MPQLACPQRKNRTKASSLIKKVSPYNNILKQSFVDVVSPSYQTLKLGYFNYFLSFSSFFFLLFSFFLK